MCVTRKKKHNLGQHTTRFQLYEILEKATHRDNGKGNDWQGLKKRNEGINEIHKVFRKWNYLV